MNGRVSAYFNAPLHTAQAISNDKSFQAIDCTGAVIQIIIIIIIG